MPSPPTTCRCVGSAIGSTISKRRPCCSDGTRAARRRDLGRIDLGEDHAGLGAAFGEDAAPRVDHQRMAERLAAVLVLAALRGREHEQPFSIARARISTCQCASPVCRVKAEGIARNDAPASASAR